VEFVPAVVDDAVAGLRHLVPGAGEVAQRLGYDQPSVFPTPHGSAVIRVQLAQGVHLGRLDLSRECMLWSMSEWGGL
jgi:hypothetical protein